MDNNKFLPIGSTVLLKDATRPVVIIGYSIIEENSNKMWDYLGCAYPIGVVTPDKNLLFDKDKIDKVLHLGYQDDEGKTFIDNLEKAVVQMKNFNKQ